MARRLAFGGRLIDRDRTVSFRWNGRVMNGFAGDTLASALLANGETLVGRSFKYHRPRGIVASGPEEPNALMGLGAHGRFEPNQRATVTELFDGLSATSQNHWPSLQTDIGVLNDYASRFFPAGFYYKTFIHPRAAWKHVFEPVIRKAAGLGAAPEAPDADAYEYAYATVDALIAGGGVSGLAAALRLARAGARVMLCEQSAHWGGRAPVDGVEIDGRPAADWIAAAVAELSAMETVDMRLRCQAAGLYDHGYVLAAERIGGDAPPSGPRQRLWRVRAAQTVVTTGAIERPLSFAGNDRPGVMLAGAVRDYVVNHGVTPGDSILIVANNDDAYLTAEALLDNNVSVAAIVDARSAPGAIADGMERRGVRVLRGMAVANAPGSAVRGALVCPMEDTGKTGETIPCDAIAMSGGWSPVVHLWSHCGGKLIWDKAAVMFRPDATRPPTGTDGAAMAVAGGAANGALEPAACLADAQSAADRALQALGLSPTGARAEATQRAEAPVTPVWMMPANADKTLQAKAFLDFQNDVKVADVRLAAQEGYESVEHAKRYTTLGMATDQGKLSNINGLAILADTLGAQIPDVGTTTFRPPYTPLTLGAIAGEARGPLFKPTRKSPMDAWHDANHAVWEPVGDWRRPYTYRRPGETIEQAVRREILNTRNNVGMLDASTLGKILVTGEDAGKFLDMLYTNMMSSLRVGRCRYGLMCTENGFLFDDGVVARVDERTFLCHTTSGGSDRVHAWMEEWLQTEWWDWKVYVTNVTEQFGQIAVVGPKARETLERLGGMDLSRDALPFMGFADGELGGIPVRAYRISFSGELSYEIAVRASQAQGLWDAILAAGGADLTPYGTEALHVMRAEKGFIMIGDETDGTVTPQDLGLHWAVSKKKADFIGKRAQERADLVRPDRKQLVGLRTADPATVLPDGAHAVAEVRLREKMRTIGHVTSTYFSPTLGHSIAMALIERGSERMGEVLHFPIDHDTVVEATVVDPVFLDKEGARQNV